MPTAFLDYFLDLPTQVWLAVNNLVVEPRCRAKYGADEWRRDRLLSLKRHMNELLFDQLPVLKVCMPARVVTTAACLSPC
jgi:hypothetical protein